MVHTTCAMRDCKSSSYINKDLRFHQFPYSAERSKLWVQACSRPDLHERTVESLKYTYICSLHFERRMYGKKSLKKTAIPTLLLPSNKYSIHTQTDPKDSEESCSKEHEVGIITEPLTEIRDPLANSNRCRFCANLTKNCVNAIDKPYLKNNKMTLILNDLNVHIDFNDTPKVCLHCDRKLVEMYNFVKLVKNAQDALLNVSYDMEATEFLVVKTECESPTPDHNDEIDQDTKEGIVDSITIDETAFVKDVFVHRKRKCDKDTKKTSIPLKKLKDDDEVTCESTELIMDIKEERIEEDDDANTSDIHKSVDSKDRDTGSDVKPSEMDIAIATTAFLNEMAGGNGFS